MVVLTWAICFGTGGVELCVGRERGTAHPPLAVRLLCRRRSSALEAFLQTTVALVQNGATTWTQCIARGASMATADESMHIGAQRIAPIFSRSLVNASDKTSLLYARYLYGGCRASGSFAVTLFSTPQVTLQIWLPAAMSTFRWERSHQAFSRSCRAPRYGLILTLCLVGARPLPTVPCASESRISHRTNTWAKRS